MFLKHNRCVKNMMGIFGTYCEYVLETITAETCRFGGFQLKCLVYSG